MSKLRDKFLLKFGYHKREDFGDDHYVRSYGSHFMKEDHLILDKNDKTEREWVEALMENLIYHGKERGREEVKRKFGDLFGLRRY